MRIYFQGYLEKSDYSLKKMVVQHGGHVDHFLSFKKTTHIICTNLSYAKLEDVINRNAGKNKNSVQVVSAQWIIDCANSFTLQPESQYSIIAARKSSLTHYFKPQKNPIGSSKKIKIAAQQLDHLANKVALLDKKQNITEDMINACYETGTEEETKTSIEQLFSAKTRTKVLSSVPNAQASHNKKHKLQ